MKDFLDVIVLAAGASVKSYNLYGIEERGYLIAVNDAALYTKCHAAFTMDRLWLEGRHEMLKILNPPEIWYRAGTPKNITPPKHWRAFEHHDVRGGAPLPMSIDRGRLEGSNSGTCAMNLAFQMKPTRVFMLGFDMQPGPQGEKHWYPDYPWGGGPKSATMLSWAEEFDYIASQFRQARIDVFNVNHRSQISAFPMLRYEQFLETTK